jgi:RNA polymerase sigma-70 factor (ECF subfamily)
MKKNWLATTWSRWFRPEPLVPDAAFQDGSGPYPGHWRDFPEPWQLPGAGEARAELLAVVDAAVAELPELWQRVLMACAHADDHQVADELGLTVEQERDILARARAAVRDRLDRARIGRPR